MRMRLKETGSLPKLDGRGRKAFVLLTVLVVIAFLALAAYRYNDLMRSEYLASHGAQRSAESRALAESGLNYSMAVLFGGQGQLAVNTSQSLEVDPANSSPLKGSFQIIQVEEESAKLNLNSLLDLDSSGDTLRQVLEKVQSTIPEMTDDVIAAIIDWMDEDDDLEEQGAETEYYMLLTRPTGPRTPRLIASRSCCWCVGSRQLCSMAQELLPDSSRYSPSTRVRSILNRMAQPLSG